MAKTLNTHRLFGTVHLDGQPIREQQVMVLTRQMDKFLGAAVTDYEGFYEITMSSADSEVTVVSKIQGPVLAIEDKIIQITSPDLRQNFNFNSSSNTFKVLQARIVTDGKQKPSSIDISITPIRMDGVSPGIEKFFLRREQEIVDSSFYDENIKDNHFILRVQNGIYRIAGARRIYKRPLAGLPDKDDFIVDTIFADGEKSPLAGEKMGGFLLDIHRDRKIDMHVNIMPSTL